MLENRKITYSAFSRQGIIYIRLDNISIVLSLVISSVITEDHVKI